MALVTTAPAPRVLADVIPKSHLNNAILVLIGAALVALGSQIAITIPELFTTPVTLQTLMVLIVAGALGTWRGAAAMTVYAALCFAGAPFMANGGTAFNVEGEMVASVGYLLGFILAAALVGYLAESGWTRTPLDTALAMVLGGTVIYACGVTYLHFAAGAPWGVAIQLGMTAFLWSDVVKILIAAIAFPLAWRLVVNAGLAPRQHMNRKHYRIAQDQVATQDEAAEDTDAQELDLTDQDDADADADAEELDLTAVNSAAEVDEDSKAEVSIGEDSIQDEIEAVDLSDGSVDLSDGDTTVDLSDTESDESGIDGETAGPSDENDDTQPELATAAAAPRRRRWGRKRRG